MENVLSTLATLVVITSQVLKVDGVASNETECYKDSSNPGEIPDYPNPSDIYKCAADQTCCYENGDASCCGDDVSMDSIIENVALWGGIVGVCLLVGGLFVYFFKSEVFICDSSGKQRKSLKEAVCCCCIENSKTGEIADINEINIDADGDDWDERNSTSAGNPRTLMYQQQEEGDVAPPLPPI